MTFWDFADKHSLDVVFGLLLICGAFVGCIEAWRSR
jgi:hypothetical protein